MEDGKPTLEAVAEGLLKNAAATEAFGGALVAAIELLRLVLGELVAADPDALRRIGERASATIEDARIEAAVLAMLGTIAPAPKPADPALKAALSALELAALARDEISALADVQRAILRDAGVRDPELLPRLVPIVSADLAGRSARTVAIVTQFIGSAAVDPDAEARALN